MALPSVGARGRGFAGGCSGALSPLCWKGDAASGKQVHGANRNPRDTCPGSAVTCCKNFLNLTQSCCPDGAVILEGRLCTSGGEDPAYLACCWWPRNILSQVLLPGESGLPKIYIFQCRGKCFLRKYFSGTYCLRTFARSLPISLYPDYVLPLL